MIIRMSLVGYILGIVTGWITFSIWSDFKKQRKISLFAWVKLLVLVLLSLLVIRLTP
jgi:hypothetical protein